MKSTIMYVTALVLVIAATCRSSETGLVGCPEPTKIANALAKIQKTDWRTISAERMISIWPNRVEESACESEKGCRLLVTKDRIISGHCECCEAFAFDVERNADGSRTEHLNNIIIHFSARNKETVIDAARKFTRSAGLPEDKVTNLNADSPQRYEWKSSGEQIQQSYVLELRITPAGRNWELYLSLGAEAA